MNRTIRAALAALALTAIAATPALAAKPLVETNEESGTFTHPVRDRYPGRGVEPVGRPDDLARRQRRRDTRPCPRALRRHDHRTRIDAPTVGRRSVHQLHGLRADGTTERQVGIVYKFSAPGLGVVAHDVGQITFFPDGSVETKGPHDVWDNGLEALICPLFE